MVTAEGRFLLTRFAAPRTGRRPSVIMLHGIQDFDFERRTYQRYADALTAEGIDAWFLRYYTPADAQKMATLPTLQARAPYERSHYADWSKLVSQTAATFLARSDCSGQIGLLGFSLGGFVAAATAANDRHIAALALLYSGMPDTFGRPVTHLPPSIELHGYADGNVPLAVGDAFVALARSLGAPVEEARYPGKGHSFDFEYDDPAARDAVMRVARFFGRYLGAG
jgi:carboxymethylenebutenolidase